MVHLSDVTDLTATPAVGVTEPFTWATSDYMAVHGILEMV